MRSQIIVYPSKIIITDCFNGNYETLFNKLSLYDPEEREYVWKAYLINSEKETVIIPRGYSLFELKNKIYPNHEVINIDSKIDPIGIDIRPLSEPRDTLQNNSLSYLLGIDDFSEYKNYNNKFLCLKTGKGKTFCTITYIANKNERAIIFLDKETLILQWKKEILKFTDIKEEDIYIISGSESVDHILDYEGLPPYKIYLASHRTMDSYSKRNGLSSINNIFKKSRITIKVFDEAHEEWRNTFMMDSITDARETLYLTATPLRSNSRENRIYQKMYEDIPQYGLEHKYKHKYHNIIYAKWNSCPNYSTIIRMTNKRGFDLNRFSDYIEDDVYNEFYNHIVNFVNKYRDDKYKLAIVLQKNSLVDKLSKDLERKFKEKIGVFTGLITNKKERYKELENKIIVTTIKSFNKAVDVKDLYTIINTVPISSKPVTEQLVGRLRELNDKECYFIDLIDTGFDEYIYQLKSRENIYNNLAKEKVVIDIK